MEDRIASVTVINASNDAIEQRSTPAHNISDSAFYDNYNSSSLTIILAVINQDQRQGQYFSRHFSCFYNSNIYMYQS